ncbi:MAG TPA: isopentenyl phosphate kinase family protein [Methanosarcinaceae archaeon]|nr:isopentenyl phosphate kinase family protein [Methanosarcinaceae archaeon]
MNALNDITILKIGGSIITDKDADDGAPNNSEIKRIAGEISKHHGKLIVVHGAGSFGHPQAKKYALNKKFDAKGALITHISVKALNHIVVESLANAGIDAIGVHPMGSTVSGDGRIAQMFIENIHLMLDNGFIPVLHGDVVMDTKLGTSILSGDQIVTYLAMQLGSARIGIGSAKDGVLDDKGDTIAAITSSNFKDIKQYIGGSESTDVTGGMLGKVVELVRLCEMSNINSRIFNAGTSGNVSRFLDGANIGTVITK